MADKKKKKYADIMASIMAPTVSTEEKKKEMDKKIKISLGGGQFVKLEKI